MVNRFSTAGYTAGGQVLRLLASAAGAVRGQASEYAQELERIERSAREDVRSRGDQLTSLAEHYLPDVSRETIAGAFVEVRDELENVLARKQLREQQLQDQWDKALDKRRTLIQDLDAQTAELDALVERRDELEEQLADRLADDDLFQDLSRRALRAEQELTANLRRVEESRQEAKKKLPEYERSRFFQYLIQRGYGTPEYNKKGLTRRLDRWVAGLVNFDKQRKSYDFLRVTPELMAAEVDRRREEFDRLMQEVEEIEQQASTELGLTDVLKEGLKAGKRRDSLLTKIETEQDSQESIERELEKLSGADNEFHQQAVARMRRFLEGLEESALDAKTRGTANTTDDLIFAEIQWLNERVDEARQQAESVRRHRADLQRRQTDLEDLARRFQIAEYDSRRSVFPSGFDPRPDIEQFLKGETGKEQIWQSIKRHQRFLPTWVEQQSPGRDFLDSEFSYLLMRVLAEAAGAAVRHVDQQQRRRKRPSRSSSVRRRARGGFTDGRGF